MALSDINKDELQDFAQAVGVDDEGKKDELVQRLEDEGYTKEDVESFQEGTFNAEGADDDEQDPVEKANEKVEEALGVREAEEEDDEEKILIKLVGPYSSITTNGIRLTQEHPFAPVKRSVAEDLLKSQSFRQAHPSEADEFYG